MPGVVRPTGATCPACESDRVWAWIPGLARCRDCRLVFADPMPTSAERLQVADDPGVVERHRRERAARERLWRKRLAVVCRHARPPARLLDVGCGDGAFVEMAASAGFAAEGLEPSREAEDARSRGVRVHHHTIEQWDGHGYGVITAWHVLEHLARPGPVLRRLATGLEPDGVLVVAVPNETRMITTRGRLFREVPLERGDVGEPHVVFFTGTTLRTALRRAGLRVVESGVDDVDLRPTAWSRGVAAASRLSARLFGWHPARALYCVARRESALS